MLALEDQFVEDGNVHKEYNEDDYFVGQKRDQPTPSFRLLCNLFKDYFVAAWPTDGDTRPL